MCLFSTQYFLKFFDFVTVRMSRENDEALLN